MVEEATAAVPGFDLLLLIDLFDTTIGAFGLGGDARIFIEEQDDAASIQSLFRRTYAALEDYEVHIDIGRSAMKSVLLARCRKNLIKSTMLIDLAFDKVHQKSDL